jgi:nicotinamidase-related amidase
MPGPQDVMEVYVTPDTLDIELESWMRQIAPYQWRPVDPLAVSASALIVVDMNRPFVEKGFPLSSPNARVVLPRVAEAVAAFRRAKCPVIWVVQGHHSVPHDRGAHLAAWWPTPLLEGTGDVELASGLEVAPGEKVIVKRRYSAFYQTDLELTLRCLGIRQVVIAGVLTHACPYATAVDAFMRDFDVYYLADATASFNRMLHVSSLCGIAGWCGHVVRTRELCAWVDGAGRVPPPT